MEEEPYGVILSTNPCKEVLVERHRGYDIIWCEGIEDEKSFYYAIPEGTYGIGKAVAIGDTVVDVRWAIDEIFGKQEKNE